MGALGKRVVRLTGEAVNDLKLLEKSQIVVADASVWDALSRRWKQRKAVQNVALFIVDELQLLGGTEGPVLEIVVSRMRYIASQTDKPCRIVGLGSSLANAQDVGEWLGATTHSLFNFHPTVRPLPLDLRMRSFDISHFGTRILAMGKPAYQAVASRGMPSLIFVPSRRQCQLTAIDMMTYAAADGRPDQFLGVKVEEIEPVLKSINELTLRQTLEHGVSYIYWELS
ncbi:unnamed protein product, partial [Chrysoparadoxa australica]